MRKQCHSLLTVFLACLIPNIALGASQQSSDTRKKTVDRFLHAWLVRKDISDALQFFDDRALKSFLVIDASCLGSEYISESDRLNPTAVKSGVSRFLFDASHHIKGAGLRDILFLKSNETPERSEHLGHLLRKVSFNQPEKDRYYLVRLASIKSLFNSKNWNEFNEKHNLRNAFVSVIQYRMLNEDERYGDDIIVAIVWTKVRSNWHIAYVAVPCD